MADLLAAFPGSPPTSYLPSKPSLSSLPASTVFVASNSLPASSIYWRLKVCNPSSSPPSDSYTPSVPLLALNGLAADEVDDGSLEREAPPSLFPIFESVSLCSVPPLLLLAGPHGTGQSLPLLLPSQKSPPPLFPRPLAEPLLLPSRPSSPPLLQISSPSFFLPPLLPPLLISVPLCWFRDVLRMMGLPGLAPSVSASFGYSIEVGCSTQLKLDGFSHW